MSAEVEEIKNPAERDEAVDEGPVQQEQRCHHVEHHAEIYSLVEDNQRGIERPLDEEVSNSGERGCHRLSEML